MNGILDQELEEELIKFTTKHEKTKPTESYKDTDVEVDIITERTKSDGDEMVEAEAERMDSTESSSSFDGSDCDDDESANDFDAFGELNLMRMKKLTNHWRSITEPLRWRCKWLELQIKRLDAEAQKYDREIERYRQQKMVRLKGFTLDDLNVKSIPFTENHIRKEVFTRKKRRKDEATEDLASYMSRHNLFSYYESSEHLAMDIGWKSHAQGNQKVGGDDEFWGNDDDLLFVEDRDDDKFFEHVFRKIDFLRSRVGELKSRADKITSENGSCNDASSDDDVDGLSLGAYIVSQLIAEYNNARTNLVHFDPTENDDYGVLIDNPRIKEEQMYNFEGLNIQPMQRPVLTVSNRPADDKRTRSILKTITNPERPNKRKRDGSRVRFII